jgi:hypothetical protein
MASALGKPQGGGGNPLHQHPVYGCTRQAPALVASPGPHVLGALLEDGNVNSCEFLHAPPPTQALYVPWRRVGVEAPIAPDY